MLLMMEATTNAIKHVFANNIHIALEYHPQLIKLSIADDGRGFDSQHCKGIEDGNFGLQGMKERIHRLSGTISVVSSEGKGTSIAVEVPLHSYDAKLARSP